MKKLAIDRFEGIYAICEDSDKRFFAIETSELPTTAKEGDVILISDDGTITVDAEETRLRRQEVLRLQRKLWED